MKLFILMSALAFSSVAFSEEIICTAKIEELGKKSVDISFNENLNAFESKLLGKSDSFKAILVKESSWMTQFIAFYSNDDEFAFSIKLEAGITKVTSIRGPEINGRTLFLQDLDCTKKSSK